MGHPGTDRQIVRKASEPVTPWVRSNPGWPIRYHRSYPTDIFELVMGMQRWSYRVAGYSGLLYDDYPPFRLKP